MDSPYLPPPPPPPSSSSSFPFKTPTLGGRTNSLSLSPPRCLFLTDPTPPLKKSTHEKERTFPSFPPSTRPSTLPARLFPPLGGGRGGGRTRGAEGNFAGERGRSNCSRRKDFEVHREGERGRGRRGGDEKSEKFSTRFLGFRAEVARLKRCAKEKKRELGGGGGGGVNFLPRFLAPASKNLAWLDFIFARSRSYGIPPTPRFPSPRLK